MKEIINRTPLLGPLARRLKHELRIRLFPGSSNYWERQYASGGTSGPGSFSKFARFKADTLNPFAHEKGVRTVFEWGSGDGNQAGLFKFPHYTGFDVSPSAVARCRERYSQDPTRHFRSVDDYAGEQAELALSLDVIYHLVEDDVFEDYMRRLFESATRYVIVYSSNSDDNRDNRAAHVRHRHFTRWVEQNAPAWRLIRHIPNPYPYTGDTEEGSFADFYIFEKAPPAA